MKTSFITLLLLISACVTVNAQDSILNRSKLPKTVYFTDDFVDNRNQWETFSHAKASSYMKDGRKFYVTDGDSGNGRVFFTKFNIDPSRNLYIENEFKTFSGPVDHGSGILFNHNSSKLFCGYRFEISPNQYFIIYKNVNDVYTNIQPWTPCNFVNTQGNNKLGIFLKGDKAYFYVNDHLVYSMKRPPFMGTDIGFSQPFGTVNGVDKWTIRYNPPAIDEVEDGKNGYKKTPLSKSVNTALDESYPVVSADGKLMFFERTTNKDHVDFENRTMMFTEYNDNLKQWSTAQPLPHNLNQGGLLQIVYVSPDKRSILIDGHVNANGKFIKRSEGVCISHRISTGWSNPENMPIEGLVNRNEYSSYTMSPNGKVLLASIAGKESLGERDIYVCFNQNGTWTSPKNLGPIVNSFGDDFSPCLAPDGVTLYYASAGKPGYGRSDIFVTRRLDNTWANWSEPKNLGPDINTSLDETWLQVDAYGQYAFINTIGNNSQGKISKIELPESARPKPVVILTGKVFNMLTKAPMQASVIYENLETGNEEGKATSSPEDGSFVVVLPFGESYGLTAQSPGFIAESKTLDLKTDTLKNGMVQMEVDLYIMPLTQGQSITLNNIFFAPDKFDLQEKSFSELDRLADIMNQNPTLQIEVSGHTDKGGADATAQALQLLSENRARAVGSYLAGKGIDQKRILTVGYGNTRPVSTDQKLNRRVEVKIMDL